MDKFFNEKLAPLVDMSQEPWAWKQDARVGQDLSKSTLREFQRAAQIRDAFFPSGSPMIGLQMVVRPNTISGNAEMVIMEVNGTVIQSQQVGNAPVDLTWPANGAGSASISIFPEIEGRASTISAAGQWAFKRLISKGSVSASDDGVSVQVRHRRTGGLLQNRSEFAAQSFRSCLRLTNSNVRRAFRCRSVFMENTQASAILSRRMCRARCSTPLENWLQGGMAASREKLGRSWEGAYLVQPIWSFWIGSLVTGVDCAGALVPSVDRVGRHFPLAIFAHAQPGGDRICGLAAASWLHNGSLRCMSGC